MPTKPQRILGLDPGFGRLGYGVIEQRNREWVLIATGIIETTAKKTFPNRLLEIAEDLETIITKYKPTQAGVEELFFAKNVTTALKVAHARGVLLVALAKAKIPVTELTPLQVKQALTGYGRAEKKQVEYVVSLILKMKNPQRLKDDAFDALAIALALAH